MLDSFRELVSFFAYAAYAYIIAQKIYNIKEMNILINKTANLVLPDGTEKLRKNIKFVKTVCVSNAIHKG
jgi:hypothetical protein